MSNENLYKMMKQLEREFEYLKIQEDYIKDE